MSEMMMYTYAYYGDVKGFSSLFNKEDYKDYDEYEEHDLSVCIYHGVNLNIEFCEYALNNIPDFPSSWPGPSLNLLLHSNLYEKYIDRFDKYLIYCMDKFENVHIDSIKDELSFIYSITNNKKDFDKLNLTYRYYFTDYYIKNFNVPDFYDRNITEIKGQDSEFRFHLKLFRKQEFYVSKLKYPEAEDYFELLLNPYYIDHKNLKEFIQNKDCYYKEEKNYKKENILKDTSLAIYCFKNNLDIDYCISRFLVVDSSISYDLYLKNKIFFKCNTLPNFDSIMYLKDKNIYLYYHFIYYSIIYAYSSKAKVNIDNFNIEFIEYNMYEGARKSCTIYIFDKIKEFINKGMKVYKYIDLKNNEY
ncbi:uncharacterized protein KGF55_000850 [Candida pseudojiufengensis]|uniref:uncharacterized protein n=1 Tax=Candida pseudojiufengensis TaxID=497109 RepID=UPI002223EF80|nr:uncharacterized protein KGF55_000850 [Candida pseudojiufengensis]KAI5966541.1 hypothetical protein KGF55_000850 [Candida pseudojiufengensis]